MKLQQGVDHENHTAIRVAKAKRFLFGVFLLASCKVALLVGILFFPSDMPNFELATLKKLMTTEKKYSDADLKALARIEARKRELEEEQAAKNLELSENTTVNTQEVAQIEPTNSATDPILNYLASNTTTYDSTEFDTGDFLPARDDISTITAIAIAPVQKTTQEAKSSPFSVNAAYASDNTPPALDPAAAKPNASPLIPQIEPRVSPVGIEQFQRPDSLAPGTRPSPAVHNPYVSPDTASNKEEELRRKEQELKALEYQMEARIDEMRGLEGNLENLVSSAGSAEDEKISHLRSVYAEMKPRQAAAVLAGLDPNTAVQILSGMDSKVAGTILSYMDPGSAVILSELLAKVSF